MAMTDHGVMMLQNCMDLAKDAPGVRSETCPAYSHEETGDIIIKVEVISDVEVEVDPVSISLPGAKSECGVSWIICVPTLNETLSVR
jgi:hypothetical protein